MAKGFLKVADWLALLNGWEDYLLGKCVACLDVQFRGSVGRAGVGKLVLKYSVSKDWDAGRCNFPLLKNEIIHTVEISSLDLADNR